MTMPSFDDRTLARVAELAIVLVLARLFTPAIVALAAVLHITLPTMPVLRRTYLLFTFVVLVCVWTRLRGETLADFGLVVPRDWARYVGQGLVIFATAMLYDVVVRPLIDPWIAHATGTSATLAEQQFSALKGHLGLLLYMLPFVWLFAAFGEEVLYRGFVLTRIAQVLGQGRTAWGAAIVLQALPFALAHAYQGPVGMAGVFVAAVITGAGTVLWGRSLWPAMLAHGLQDTVGLYALYAGLVHG